MSDNLLIKSISLALHGSVEGSGIEDLIVELYNYQLKENQTLRRFVELSRRPKAARSVEDLTFLPIQFFKQYDIKTGEWQPEKIFRSSGTGGNRSRHMVGSLEAYYERTQQCFRQLFGRHSEKIRHLVFMPFYQANPDSSLLYMMRHFIDQSVVQGSQFVSDIKELDDLVASGVSGPKTMIWTVSYGLLDMIERSEIPNMEDIAIIETGGMKGTRREMRKTQLHLMAKSRWEGVQVHSEYGMCELSSQAYWLNDRFEMPHGCFVYGHDVDDPVELKREGKRLQLCMIDLANYQTCSFIATEDIGSVFDTSSFTVEGRLHRSDLRGCNLMYDERSI